MKFARIKLNGRPVYVKVSGYKGVVLSGSVFGEYSETDSIVDMNTAEYMTPCDPTKIVAVGLNYRDHAEEMGLEIPDFPALFIKPSSSAAPHKGDIIYPPMSKQVDYEAEFAIVIGKEASYISETEADDYILGYTCLNDVTARDLQALDSQWTRAKSFDTFAPIGPVIETELDPDNADIRLLLNGEVKQKSSTANFIFKTKRLVSLISQVMTLYPGDIITTGTPSGIGPMRPGDKVEVEIEGIGTLLNTVKEKQND